MGPGGASRRATEAQAYGSTRSNAKPEAGGGGGGFDDDPTGLPARGRRAG